MTELNQNVKRMNFSGGGMPRKVVDYSAGAVRMLEVSQKFWGACTRAQGINSSNL